MTHLYVTDLLPLLVGPIIGSFLGVVIDRLPRQETLGGRSACRNCTQRLGIVDLIPLFSFLLLKGRCRHCQYPLPKQLFVLELLTPLLFMPVLLLPSLAEQILAMILISSLIVLAFIDFEHLWLPDTVTLPLIIMGLAMAYLGGTDSLLNSALGVAAGYGSIALLRLFYLWYKKIEAIGLGDAKLLAAAGAWLGWASLPEVLLIASLSGIAMYLIQPPRHDDGKIAFGVNLSAGFYVLYILKAMPTTPPSFLHYLF